MRISKEQYLTILDDDGAPTDQHLAHITEASDSAVQKVLAADPDSHDGRSQFVWVRLQNGDLLLGVFPQGDTYEATELEHAS